MATPIKLIQDWENILIDTSIILNLFLSEKSDDNTVLFVRRLIDFLTEQKPSSKKNRKFYISTISLSELLIREDDAEKIKKILRVLNSDNTEFIPFDLSTSLRFNGILKHRLLNKELNKFAQAFGFKSGEFMMAREWITRDYMILVTGMEHGVDVIITTDKRTMYPLASELNMFCALAFPELFDQFKTAIQRYKHSEVEQFLIEHQEAKLKKAISANKVTGS